MKNYRITLWVLLGVQELVLVPVMVLLWLRLYKRRNCHISRKRRVFWVLLFSAIYIVYLGVALPFRLVSALDKGWRDSQKQFFAQYSFYATLLTVAAWMDLFRTWMLFYDLKLSRALTKLKWAALIDSTLAAAVSRPSLVERHSALSQMMPLPSVDDTTMHTTASGNWYLSHRRNFGNEQFCFSLMALAGALPYGILLIVSCTLAISGLLSVKLCNGIMILLFIGLRVANVALYCKTHAVNDKIFLREELRHLAKIHFGIALLSLVSIVVWKFKPVNFVTRTIFVVLFFDVMIVGKFSFLVYWCVDKMDSEGLLADYCTHNTVSRTGLSSISAAGRRRTQTKTASLKQIVCDNDGFQLFMTHLVHEFSAECLLSVVEFVQFKQLVTRHLADGTCAEMHSAVANESQSVSKCPNRRGLYFDSFEFPRCVPKSTIVSAADCGNNAAIGTDKVVAVICALYDKYMCPESAMQINMSAQTQVEMEAFVASALERTPLADDSEWLHTVSHAFDEVISENIKLMTYSVARFSKTNEYNMWHH